MNPAKSYLGLTAAIFAIVGTAHVLRAFGAWPVVLNGYEVPVLISWPIGIGALALSVWAIAQLRRG